MVSQILPQLDPVLEVPRRISEQRLNILLCYKRDYKVSTYHRAKHETSVK